MQDGWQLVCTCCDACGASATVLHTNSNQAIANAVHLSIGIAVGSARTLLPWDKITKLRTSLVICSGPSTDGLGPRLTPNTSKSPPQMCRFSPKREPFSSTVAALSGLCGQLHLPPNAFSAGISVTQLLAARKSTPNDATVTDCLPHSLCLPFGLHSLEDTGTP